MTTTFFEYSTRTTINSGAGSRIMVPSLVKGLGGKRVILFTDKGLTEAGVTEKITELFAGISSPVQLVAIFDGIVQDARASKINQAIQYVKEVNADTIIALGGGSVLDTAKAVRWALQRGYSNVEKVLTFSTKEQWADVEEITIPFIAIPTTAGTGSEVSSAALVYNEELKIKAALTSPYLNPNIAVLDPELTVGLPAKITAFTGMDALTHAIEGFFSPRANPFSDAYALHASSLIFENLQTVVKDGANLEARSKMLMASSMAIIAFTQTTSAIPVHNIAHVFGAKFGVPHGLANAVLLPEVMEALPSLYLPRIIEFSQQLGLKGLSTNRESCLEETILHIRKLRDDIGLPSNFADYQINTLENIVYHIHNDPTALGFKIPEDVIENVTNKVVDINIKAV